MTSRSVVNVVVREDKTCAVEKYDFSLNGKSSIEGLTPAQAVKVQEFCDSAYYLGRGAMYQRIRELLNVMPAVKDDGA